MLSKIRLILWLFILLIAGYFVAMNNISVTVNLLPGYQTVPLPLSIIILMSIIIGAILAILIAIGDWIKFKIEISRLKKQLEICEKEKESLKMNSLKESEQSSKSKEMQGSE
jgi:Uncharacterized integral membrane protein